jgi:hypothetical protein
VPEPIHDWMALAFYLGWALAIIALALWVAP